MAAEWNATCKRASTALPFFIRVMILWKVVLYLLSFLIKLSDFIGLNPAQTLVHGQLWRPLTSSFYTDSLFSGVLGMWVYIAFSAYVREMH